MTVTLTKTCTCDRCGETATVSEHGSLAMEGWGNLTMIQRLPHQGGVQVASWHPSKKRLDAILCPACEDALVEWVGTGEFPRPVGGEDFTAPGYKR